MLYFTPDQPFEFKGTMNWRRLDLNLLVVFDAVAFKAPLQVPTLPFPSPTLPFAMLWHRRISPRRALVELVATAFVLIALAIAVVPYDQARETYFQIAGSLSLRTEDAPQLANVASQRVLATGSYGP